MADNRVDHGINGVHQMSDTIINEKVIERVEFIDKELLLNGEWERQRNNGYWEKWNISELDRESSVMEKRELITICQQAVRRYPMMYLQVLAEYIVELIKQRRAKNNENS